MVGQVSSLSRAAVKGVAFGVPYNQVTNSQQALFKERFALFACGLEMRGQMGQENIRPQVKRVARMMRLRGGFLVCAAGITSGYS
jgi:hypothetical protein